jgi:hypothetical protein
MKNKFYINSIFVALFFMACSESNKENPDCGQFIEISKQKYDAIVIEPGLFIDSPTIDGNCLTVMLGYSGCNDGHEMSLITSGDIAESYPVQISFKFLDHNPQACQAFFTQEYQFDLSRLSEILTDEDRARLIFVQDNKEVLWEL